MTDELAPGLRERTRRAVRAELMSVAMDLFAERGYDTTTVEEIAAAVGISKRSFFRYFGSKEDVVLGNLEMVGQELAAALARRPPEEPPWPALRRAFEAITRHQDADPARAMVLLRMLRDTPVLKARHLEKVSRWQVLLTAPLTERLPPASVSAPAVDDPRPAAIVGAALACLDAAQGAWLDAGGAVPLGSLLDATMSAVGPLTVPTAAGPARPGAAAPNTVDAGTAEPSAGVPDAGGLDAGDPAA